MWKLSYVWSQSKQFDDHLNSEECGKDHVQDVHNKVEKLWLLIVLVAPRMKRNGAKMFRNEYWCIWWIIYLHL